MPVEIAYQDVAPHQFVQILTTIDSQEVANLIGRELIKSSAAACVQIEGPLHSIYEWEDKIESCQEFRLAIKTMATRVEDVVNTIQSHHNYDTPQLVVVPIIGGSRNYLDWVKKQTSENQS